MVKITGRTRDAGHLKAHLAYISRNGTLALEGPDGERLAGRKAIADLASDWRAEQAMEPGRRRDAPVSASIVLSMPAGTDPERLRDAARAFATQIFGERFPYVFALHDEGRHPHVHLTVRRLGRDGERLNPRKADLQVWRETFAARLREREVAAEATPRRARGVVLKAERPIVRRMRERFARGAGPLPAVLEAAYREALQPPDETPPWSAMIRARQREVRRRYVAVALALERSPSEGDQALGQAVRAFVQSMPAASTREERLRGRAEEDRRHGLERKSDELER
jgi:hypothetical protein